MEYIIKNLNNSRSYSGKSVLSWKKKNWISFDSGEKFYLADMSSRSFRKFKFKCSKYHWSSENIEKEEIILLLWDMIWGDWGSQSV